MHYRFDCDIKCGVYGVVLHNTTASAQQWSSPSCSVPCSHEKSSDLDKL